MKTLELTEAQNASLRSIGLARVMRFLDSKGAEWFIGQEGPQWLHGDESVVARWTRPNLGSYWEGQGGVLAGESRDWHGRPFDLIVVCDRDLKPILTDELQYGNYGDEIVGASYYSDGKENTESLSKVSPLAQAVIGKTFVGNEDCYIPSIGELNICRANVPELFPKKVFWSSTQDGANYARSQYFEGGYSNWDGKDGRFHAFVVRRVYR